MSSSLEPADVDRAARAIAPALPPTPCARSLTLGEIAGCDVVLKFENLQFTASFKERGALNKLLALGEDERARGVVCMSAGNHAQAVAHHARRLGIAATVVMPRVAPFVKVEQTRRHGARVVLEGESLAEAEDAARALAAREGLVFVPPYDDPWVIAGQGTVALEMLDAFPDLDVLVVPAGGGGLLAGMALAAKARRPGIELVGVQCAAFPQLTNAWRAERAAGDAAAPSTEPTVAEGIAVARPGALTAALVARLVDAMLIVDESLLERAVQLLVEIEKTVAEGAGAAGLAALLAEPARFAGRRVGVVISGGNIDTRLLSLVLLRGLVRDGRLVRLRVRIPDLPGGLARVAALLGRGGGNILEVQHQRAFAHVPLRVTEIEFVLETRSREHVHELLAALAADGLRAEIVEE
jgi:threonine dehydratase